MYFPVRKDFVDFFSRNPGSGIVPVCMETVADLDTPISAYQKLCKGSHSFLLESAEGAGRVARFSFVGYDPLVVIESRGRTITVTDDRFAEEVLGNPFEVLRQQLRRFSCSAGDLNSLYPAGYLPAFASGLVGYLGHDMVRFIENLPGPPPDDLGLPDCLFILPRRVVAFDHLLNRVKLIYNLFVDETKLREDPAPVASLKEAYDQATGQLEEMAARLRRGVVQSQLAPEAPETAPVVLSLGREDFMERVEAAIEYIRQGEIFQVVLSERLETSLDVPPLDVYRRLRTLNPSPYMFYLNFPRVKLAGSSPEMLVRVRDGLARTRPLAGTRPRGSDEREDAALAVELAADEKERAEHIMLVDLGRNDLGRVCRYGTVEVVELLAVERYSHVMHLVSEVEGILREDCDALDALAAAFPAGTLTGAPKVRAMEIIDELEPVRRGPYGGAVGYLGLDGNLDTCITIRTIVMTEGRAFVQAGAGIVADSVPEKEFEESMRKAAALLLALGQRLPAGGGPSGAPQGTSRGITVRQGATAGLRTED